MKLLGFRAGVSRRGYGVGFGRFVAGGSWTRLPGVGRRRRRRRRHKKRRPQSTNRRRSTPKPVRSTVSRPPAPGYANTSLPYPLHQFAPVVPSGPGRTVLMALFYMFAWPVFLLAWIVNPDKRPEFVKQYARFAAEPFAAAPPRRYPQTPQYPQPYPYAQPQQQLPAQPPYGNGLDP